MCVCWVSVFFVVLRVVCSLFVVPFVDVLLLLVCLRASVCVCACRLICVDVVLFYLFCDIFVCVCC